ACGCTVVASNTPPVAELIHHERNGLLAEFYDIDGLADLVLRVLHDPAGHRPLGEAGQALIEQKYALRRTLPRMLDLYRRAALSPLAPEAGARGEGAVWGLAQSRRPGHDRGHERR